MILSRILKRNNKKRLINLFLYIRKRTGLNILGALIPHEKAGSRKRFKENKTLKGTKKGKTCIILGSGPGVQNLPLKEISDYYILSLNKAYYLKDEIGRYPDGVVFADLNAAKEYGHDIFVTDISDIFIADVISHIIPKETTKKVFQFGYYTTPRMHQGFYQNDITKPLYQSSTVAHYALQIAQYMGFDKIVFVGVDLNFHSEQGHFYDDSTTERQRLIEVSRKKQDIMIEGLVEAKKRSRFKAFVFTSGIEKTNNPYSYISFKNINSEPKSILE